MLNMISSAYCKENYDSTILNQEPNVSKKRVSVRAGNSVLWLQSDLDLLPQKEEMRRRHFVTARPGHDKQVRPRQQNKKHDYMP